MKVKAEIKSKKRIKMDNFFIDTFIISSSFSLAINKILLDAKSSKATNNNVTDEWVK